jgi:hypothetical protein
MAENPHRGGGVSGPRLRSGTLECAWPGDKTGAVRPGRVAAEGSPADPEAEGATTRTRPRALARRVHRFDARDNAVHGCVVLTLVTTRWCCPRARPTPRSRGWLRDQRRLRPKRCKSPRPGAFERFWRLWRGCTDQDHTSRRRTAVWVILATRSTHGRTAKPACG